MNRLRCVLLLLSTTVATLGQTAHQSRQTPSLPRRGEAAARSLYQQVVAHTTISLPEPEDMKFFAPHLSKALLHRIGLARACERDGFGSTRDAT